MRAITGCFAILFGTLGWLITLAIIVLVWWGTLKLLPLIEKLMAHADDGIVRVEKVLTELSQQFTSTTESVEAIRTSAQNAAREHPNTPATKAEIERVKSDLLPLIDRTNTIRESLPQTAETIDDAANFAQQSGNTSRADRLRSIASSVREASQGLDAVYARSTAIREDDSPPTAKELADLAEQTHKSLDRLTKALADVKQESETLRKDLPEARRTINRWIITASAIITAILLWIGFGQLALVGWGWRRFSSRTVIPPVAPTPGNPSAPGPK